VKPVRGGLLLALGVVSLLAILPVISWATYPGQNGRIAFSGQLGGGLFADDDIYSVRPDGTSFERLTTNNLYEYSPAWSANGRRLAFVRENHVQVFTMRADGSDKERVTHENGAPRLAGPYFSPNGRRIVYGDGGGHLIKIRSDGTNRRAIIKGAVLQDPAYSPRGERIVFAGRPRGRSSGIWTVHPDRSHLRRLTGRSNSYYCDGSPTGACVSDTAPDYSPDGSHIAFSRCDYGTYPPDCDIYVMRANGSYQRSIWHAHDAFTHGLAYSPEGDRIVFSFYPDSATFENVYTMTPNGSDLRFVTDNHGYEDAGEPSWQPIPAG
jgi:Tol biopolymer transport system component